MYVPKKDLIMRDMKHIKTGQYRHYRKREETGAKILAALMAFVCFAGVVVLLALMVTDKGLL